MAPLVLPIFWFRDLRRATGSSKREDFKVLQDFLYCTSLFRDGAGLLSSQLQAVWFGFSTFNEAGFPFSYSFVYQGFYFTTPALGSKEGHCHQHTSQTWTFLWLTLLFLVFQLPRKLAFTQVSDAIHHVSIRLGSIIINFRSFSQIIEQFIFTFRIFDMFIRDLGNF